MASKTDIDNQWEPYSNTSKQQKKLLKDIQSMWDYAADINHLLSPHYYIVDDSCYGENDVARLLKSKYVDTDKWPQPTMSVLCTLSDKEKNIQYYTNLFEKMIRQYTKYMLDNKLMLSFEDIMKHKNIVDITKLFDHDGNIDMPDIEFYEHEIETLRTYGWYSFIPCFDEFVIKVNKRRAFHVIKQNVDISNKSFTITISDYSGNRYDWILSGYTTLTLTFDNETSDGLPCAHTINNTMSYEHILTEYIAEQNWTKQEITFWLDMFSVNYPSKMILAEFDIEKKTEANCKATLLSDEHFSQLQRISHAIDITTTKNEQSAHDYLLQQISNKLLIDYLKCIGIINYNLLVSTGESQKDQTTNSETRIIALSQNDKGDSIREINNIRIQSKDTPILQTSKGKK